MKRLFIFFLICWALAPPVFAQTPKSLGPFTLGRHIKDYSDQLQLNTSLALRYQEFLKEIEIKETREFKSGLICYGTCQAPGRIVRIKLKYRNESLSFFETLLEKLKTRYGAPMEWRGDPFHVVMAWKWGFTDKNGNHISLILQHNTLDQEQKMGNSIKITVTNWIDDEEACFSKKHPELARSAQGDFSQDQGDRAPDWKLLLPR